jgi:hypothetical protein
MKLSKYIEGLQSVLKEHGDLNVVYSSDDEGNSHHSVVYDPSVGVFDEEENTFYHTDDAEYYEEFTEKKYKINSVIIN